MVVQLLWMLSASWVSVDRPKMVFFYTETHWSENKQVHVSWALCCLHIHHARNNERQNNKASVFSLQSVCVCVVSHDKLISPS